MICIACTEDKPPQAFAIKTGAVRSRTCKQCKNEYNKSWYQANRKKRIAAAGVINRRHGALLREKIAELKSVPCADCGEAYPPYVMDFDHLDPGTKVMAVGRLLRNRPSLQTLLAEIAKCQVVCSNCHRIRTYTRRAAP